jgi:hypothetical protein
MVLSLESGTFEALAVSTTPLATAVTLLYRQWRVLTHSFKDLFAKELCGFLASLEEGSSRYAKDIACVLAKKALKDIIRKVERRLSRKYLSKTKEGSGTLQGKL